MAELNQEKKRSNFAEMTPDKHKQLSSAGGKKSGEVRRRKRDLREATDVLLSLKVKDPKLKQEMIEGGIKKSDLDNQMALVFKQFIKALGGSTRAAEFLADLLGERNVNDKDKLSLQQDEHDDPLTASIKEMLSSENKQESED